MESRSRLGEYLKARRVLLDPHDVGLAPGIGTRRVPGLRREEVAILAGISTDYYRRLEQGRDANPSPQVVTALARALRLNDAGAAHLRSLALAGYTADLTDGDDVLPESVQWLIDSWPLTAAVVHNRYIDVLASNALARAISPAFRVGLNDVESLFADPSQRSLHRDWEGLIARSVALLRRVGDKQVDDERLTALVARISERSDRFRALWQRNDVAILGGGTHVLDHPIVGELVLQFAQLPLVGTGGHTIFCYFAEPGTPAVATLQRLADLGGGPAGTGRIRPIGLASRYGPQSAGQGGRCHRGEQGNRSRRHPRSRGRGRPGGGGSAHDH